MTLKKGWVMKMNLIDDFEFYARPDFHSVFSIQLCELIEGGWIDFSDESWDFDSYKKTIIIDGVPVIDENDREQRDRLWEKFKNRYYWREIGITPPGQWKWELLRKLNEIMPKYKYAYKLLDDDIDILQTYAEYGKSRNIFSEFPQTMLGDNEDYASTGTDKQHENIYLGNWIDTMKKLKSYSDVDVMILEELETFFSVMFTVNVNGY